MNPKFVRVNLRGHQESAGVYTGSTGALDHQTEEVFRPGAEGKK